jgi:hypothetical protein
VTALVEVERSLTGLPSRIPYSIAILDIEISTAVVHRYIIVAITGDAAELCILIEAVTASGVRDQREEVFIAQIVNPRPGCLRVSNNILAMLVVEVTIAFLLFHNVYVNQLFKIMLQKYEE